MENCHRFDFSNQSTNVGVVEYHREKKKLVVNFKRGKVYEYSPVSLELYHGLYLAKSVGKFLREKIIFSKDITGKEIKQ